MTPTAIVAYLALFATVGFLFVLASLFLGRLLRAHEPTPQKVETYECGEPSIGPGTVQFDLRFYVVALVFLIFEVEVAFFFPPAVIFGTATQYLANSNASSECAEAECALPNNAGGSDKPIATELAKAPTVGEEMHLSAFSVSAKARTVGEEIVLPPDSAGSAKAPTVGEEIVLTPYSASKLAAAALVDLGVFFGVLLVGFAYVWRCGDLNWVRAVRHPRAAAELGPAAIRPWSNDQP